MNWDLLLNPGTLALLVPILGLVYWIVSAVLKHRERMALIERGIDPDARKQREKDAESRLRS